MKIFDNVLMNNLFTRHNRFSLYEHLRRPSSAETRACVNDEDDKAAAPTPQQPHQENRLDI